MPNRHLLSLACLILLLPLFPVIGNAQTMTPATPLPLTAQTVPAQTQQSGAASDRPQIREGDGKTGVITFSNIFGELEGSMYIRMTGGRNVGRAVEMRDEEARAMLGDGRAVEIDFSQPNALDTIVDFSVQDEQSQLVPTLAEPVDGLAEVLPVMSEAAVLSETEPAPKRLRDRFTKRAR